jgi:integrase/recombinase XerD
MNNPHHDHTFPTQLDCPGGLDGNPLAPAIPLFAETLSSQGYAEQTVQSYLSALACLSAWMAREHLPLEGLDEQAVRRFLHQHPKPQANRCPICRRSGLAELRAASNHLLKMLRDRHWIADPRPAEDTPAGLELDRFRHYLEDVCGLAALTCNHRVKHVGGFLARFFGNDAVVLARPKPSDVEAFVMGFAGRWSSSPLRVLCGSLNSYLRFKALCGENVAALQAGLPKPVTWPHAALPKSLSEAQLKSFLDSFDRATPLGKRDYAAARCLADLGLRGQEVACLRLEDIDWRSGTLTVRGGKNKRTQVLPLPLETGRALADYLQQGRPKTNLRVLFVRHRAPLDTPLSIAAIRNIANRAWKRCALDGQFHNTHVLRHTLAGRIQAAGRPVKEIADILRHHGLDTAARYVRIDVERLRAVALPWPGRRP